MRLISWNRSRGSETIMNPHYICSSESNLATAKCSGNVDLTTVYTGESQVLPLHLAQEIPKINSERKLDSPVDDPTRLNLSSVTYSRVSNLARERVDNNKKKLGASLHPI
jgi:hypothetical protein